MPGRRADFGAGAQLPPELDPRLGRDDTKRRLSVSDLQARNPVAPSRGRHRPRRSDRRAAGGTGGDPPRRPDLRRATLLGGRVLVALLSVAALIGSGIAWATYRQFTQGIQHGVALPNVEKGKKDIDGKDQNILLLGNDSVAGATHAELAALDTGFHRSSSATDTMMVLHIPADGKKATIVSFPRDSWVDIPGHGDAKINAAYVDGFNDAANQGAKTLLDKQSAGIALTAHTISNLTGLHIDHYVQVNLLGFYEISEAIGGVDLCLNEAQNASTEGDSSHPNGYSGIDLEKGWNRNVKGKQALAFVRQRHGLPRGDIDRIVRQQYFLSAVFHKAVSGTTLLNPFKLRRLLNSVKKSLITDPSLDILGFVQEFSKIAGGHVTFGTPPWKFGQIGDQDVVLVDPDAVKAFVNRMIGAPPDKKLAKAPLLRPNQVSVVVLNQSNRDLIATKNAATLGQAGFLARVGETHEHTDQSVIEYPDGQQSQAKTLARYVPGVPLVRSPELSKVTLILGRDGLHARSTPRQAKPHSAKPHTPSGVTNAAQNSKKCIN